MAAIPAAGTADLPRASERSSRSEKRLEVDSSASPSMPDSSGRRNVSIVALDRPRLRSAVSVLASGAARMRGPLTAPSQPKTAASLALSAAVPIGARTSQRPPRPPSWMGDRVPPPVAVQQHALGEVPQVECRQIEVRAGLRV